MINKILILAILLAASPWTFATPVAIEKNIYIRSIKNGRAILNNNDKGYYLLKAGSIIDIPDQFVIRNSSGGVDISRSLSNWMKKDQTAGSYKIESTDHKIIGEDQFFRLIVLQAAPGSNIPSGEAFIALNFLNRTKAIRPIQKNAAVSTPENAPIPQSRPEKGSGSESEPKAQPTEDLSSGFDMSGSNSGTQDPSYPYPESQPAAPTIAKPTRSEIDDVIEQQSLRPAVMPPDAPTKQQILKPTSDVATGGTPPVTYFETSKIERKDIALPDRAPTPTTRPEEKVAERTEDTIESAQEAGQPNKICPNGDCGVYDSGDDKDTELFCKQVGEGGFPQNLNKLANGSSAKKILRASLKWSSLAMRDPKTCGTLCKFESSGLARLIDGRESNHKSYCARIEKCMSGCNTSDLIPKTKCSKAVTTQTKYCKNHCSPYLGLDSTKRNIHLKSIFADMSGDLEQFNPDFANRMKSNGFFTTMPSRLLCLNRRRENVDLEPLARNCASTAIGIGQVLKGTFYYTLGLANRTQQNMCLNIPIKDLKSRCKGWDKNAFRKSAYWKYMDFTPKELYDLRTTDAELQARSSYAVILDKMRISGFNLNKAYKGYFGKSDKSAINRIENCVRTGR